MIDGKSFQSTKNILGCSKKVIGDTGKPFFMGRLIVFTFCGRIPSFSLAKQHAGFIKPYEEVASTKGGKSIPSAIPRFHGIHVQVELDAASIEVREQTGDRIIGGLG
jgi:hypothetical protein